MKRSLRINQATLNYDLDAEVPAWSLPINAIVLIAEYTTSEGPHCDDYFLVFVTVEDGRPFYSTCSSYAEGRDSVLMELQDRLGSAVQLKLTASTDWRSRVVWPPSMEGKEYFTFKPIPPNNTFQRLKQKILGTELEYQVSNAVSVFVTKQQST